MLRTLFVGLLMIAGVADAWAAGEPAGDDAIELGEDEFETQLSTTMASAQDGDGDGTFACPSGQMPCGNTDYCIPTGASCCDLNGSYCPAGSACDGQGHCFSTQPPPPATQPEKEGCSSGGDGVSLIPSLLLGLSLLLRRKAGS